MLYRIATAVAIVGCLVMLLLVFLEQYKGYSEPFLKPILWITILAFVIRIFIRTKSKR